MRNLLLGAAFAACAAMSFTASAANAATLVISVDDIFSYGEFGDPANTLLNFDIGANSHITGIAYDVTLTAYGPSWLSELVVGFSNTSLSDGVDLTPGFADTDPGTGSYADSAYLPDFGLDFSVESDGLLWLEFFESFDDGDVNPDGLWSGTLTITYTPQTQPPAIPEPATWAMMIAGFGLVGTGLRRRRAVTSA